MRLAPGPAEGEPGPGLDRFSDPAHAVRPYLDRHPSSVLVFYQDRRPLRSVIERILLERVRLGRDHARPPGGHLVSAQNLYVAGLTGKVLMRTRSHGLLDLDVTVLACCLSVDMTHAALAGLVAVHTLHLLDYVHVFRQTRRLGEIPAEITVPPSSLHGPGMADEGAPAASGAIGRRRDAGHGVSALLPRGRVMAVQASRVADVARLLLRDRLVVREREIDLLDDLFGVLEGEPVAFRPADRLGVRKGRPSIIRAVNIVPDPHGALPEVRAHDARGKLFDLLGMAS